MRRGLWSGLVLFAALCRAQDAAPQDFATQFNLGFTLYREQKLAEAIGPLTAAAKLQPSSFPANYVLGAALAQSGQQTEAIRRLRTAHSIDANHIGVMTLLGVLYLDGGYSLDAADVLEQARGRDPSNEKIQLMLIQAHHQNFNFEKALKLAHAAATQFPRSADAQFRLGYELETAGQFDEADAAYGRSIAIDPRYAAAHLALGRLNLRSGRAADAVAELELALRDDPRNAETKVELAKALIATKVFSRAETVLLELIGAQPDEPAFHALLAQVYSAQGKRDLSDSERARYLALNGQAAHAGGMSGSLTSAKARRFEP